MRRKMMAEYLSREDYCEENCGKENREGYKTCTNCGMLNVPSADVQPVVHAYWIELPKALNPNENPCKCSNCGHVLSFMNYYPKSKYCDDCGARMDLKDGDAKWN
jgi:uncharacterized OB-fold protein